MEKTCISCRYGNNCPYGGSEIYCLKDYEFSNVLELCSLFDDIKMRDVIFSDCKRDKNTCCDEYRPIDHGKYYTYNDFDY